MPDPQPKEEVAHVLGCDIVAFSQKSIEAQIVCVQTLHQIVQEVLGGLESPPVLLDTGDGAIFVFSGSLSPALRAAEQLALRSAELQLSIRVGLHTGPVARLGDANGRFNAYGPGVNIAQRVMNAAKPGGRSK